MEIHDRNALQELLSLPTLPKLPDAIATALQPPHSRLAIVPFRRKPLPDSAATRYETWRSRFQQVAAGDRQEIGKYLDSLQRAADREKAKADFLRHRAQIRSTLQSVEKAFEVVAAGLLGKTMQSSLRNALENTQQAFLLARHELTRAEQTVREINASLR